MGTVMYSDHLVYQVQPVQSDSDFRGSAHTFYSDQPMISFTIGNHDYLFKAWQTWQGRYQNGESVTVYFDPKNPANAWIKNDILGWPLGLLIMGLILIMIGSLVPDFDTV